MKYIKQFRYYGDNNSNNYPSDLTKDKLTNKNIFEGYGTITKLGIQGRGNTQVYLNGSIYPILLGVTGIYELDLEDYGQIFEIRFAPDSLDVYGTAGSTDRLLIDIVYEGAGADV